MNLTTHTTRSGSAIVLVISIMTAIMVIVGVAAEYTMLIGRNVQRSNALESAVAIADGCIDNNFAYWRAICRAQPTQVKTTNAFSGMPLPTATQFPNVPNFTATSANYSKSATQTVQQCKVIAVDPEENPLTGSTPVPPAVGRYVNYSDPDKTTATYNYLASAYVTLPALRGNVVARVQRIFQKRQESPWNYAIFYVDPLEIHPGPEFNITGWVHTNGSLYTGHKTLHFLDKVSYVDQWYRGSNPGDPGFMPGDPRAVGGSNQETPTLPSWLSNQPPDRDDSHEPVGLDPEVFNPTDANTNNDGYRELIEPPAAGSDPLTNERYYNQADIIIKIDDTPTPNTITFMKPDGSIINSSSTGNKKKLYDMFNGAITTNEVIQDYREQAPVRLATLDISKIIKPDNSEFKSDKFNGVVYIYDNSASAGARRGVRLKNGSLIPQDGLGLTVASVNPVYIQGDLNTGTNPPSNSGNPADAATPQASGYIRQPCSVVADAVNILSNAWLDSNSTASVGSRVASNTTVNAAIVSGNVPTGQGGVEGYSGGAENFPRFLEKWGSGHTFTYYGSMVELYQSQQATGRWGSANVYDPPTRQWFFDKNFKTSAPPGTLMVYTYTKSRWALVP